MAKEVETGTVQGVADGERREALIKLGKYAAYATPIVVASVSAAQAVTISGVPTPSPIPPPVPSPAPVPPPAPSPTPSPP